jgi:hypothetical protein
MTSIPCRIAIQGLYGEDPQPRAPREVIDALRARYPEEWTDGTVRAHLIGLSRNHPSAHYYPHLQAFAFLTQMPDGRYAVDASAATKLTQATTARRMTDDQRPRQGSRRPRVNRQVRMSERVQDLASNFARYLGIFEKNRPVFVGPSVHFHVRAIERRLTHDSVRSAVSDDELLGLIEY